MMTTSNRRYLLDTNVLVYAVDSESRHFDAAKHLWERYRADKIEPVVAHQNLLEFIATLMRDYDVSAREAADDAQAFAGHCEVIFPLPSTFHRFAELIHSVEKERYPFDVYLAATMIDNEVQRIITANVGDFGGLGLAEVADLRKMSS